MVACRLSSSVAAVADTFSAAVDDADLVSVGLALWKLQTSAMHLDPRGKAASRTTHAPELPLQ